MTVNPARAGMILVTLLMAGPATSKPRASGDDPDYIPRCAELGL